MFKHILGYEGLYKISDKGKVWSFHSRSSKTGKTCKGQLKNSQFHPSGYRFVILYKKAKPKSYLVHRLVGKAFIQNPNNLKYINHKDGNKKNNSVSNLEWVTFAENMKHAWANGLCKSTPARIANARKVGIANRKYKWSFIKKIRKEYKTGVLQKDLAEKYQLDFRVVNAIVRHKIYRDAA